MSFHKYHLRFRLLLICLLAASWPLQASATPPGNLLYGQVSGQNGQPLRYAVVSIPDLNLSATTDSTGSYRLQHVPQGQFLVEARLLGYVSATAVITISSPETRYDFRLQETFIERSGVVVTGISMATEQRQSVTPIQSIRIRELQQNGASSNIIEALSRLPGMSQLSTGPAISKPMIRGLGFNRIITLHDGIRQEGQQWGDEHGIEIDDYHISRVEVLKGPASLAYGSDALAGVINIRTEDAAPQGTIDGQVTTAYQTNNGQAALHGRLRGHLKGGFTFDGYATLKRAHDYHNRYDGYVHNTRFQNNNYGLSLGVIRPWGYSRLSFSSFNQKLGIAEGERDSLTGGFMRPAALDGEEVLVPVTSADDRSYKPQFPYQRIGHHKLAWNQLVSFKGGGRLQTAVGLQQNEREEFEEVLSPDEAGLQFRLRTLTYEARYFFPAWKQWRVSTGFNGMLQGHSNRASEEFLVPEHRINDGGVFVMARGAWDRWVVSGGLRLDARSLKADALYLDADGLPTTPQLAEELRFEAIDRQFQNLAASAGVNYAPGNMLNLRLNLASGFRAPNIAELSAHGVHEGSLRYEYGQTGLRPERSLQADLGMELQSAHVLLQASVFYNYINDFIFLRKLNSVQGGDSIPQQHNEEGYAAFIFDQTRAGLYGGELYLDLHPHPLDWLHLEQTCSYVRGRSLTGPDSLRNLPFIPEARWLSVLKAQHKSWGRHLRQLYARIGVDVHFGQGRVLEAYGTETPAPAYALLQAGLGFDVVGRKGQTLLSLALAGDNLLDAAYQNHLSRLRYGPENPLTGRRGMYQMGRNFSLSCTIPLVFR